MEWDRETGEVLHRTGRGYAEERGSEDVGRDDARGDVERIDALEFLARVVNVATLVVHARATGRTITQSALRCAISRSCRVRNVACSLNSRQLRTQSRS